MPIPLPPPLPNPCLEIDFPDPPQLPDGITLGIPIPPLPDLDLALCCKLPPLPDFIPPLPIVTLNPAIIQAINLAISGLFGFFDGQQFECPLE